MPLFDHPAQDQTLARIRERTSQTNGQGKDHLPTDGTASDSAPVTARDIRRDPTDRHRR